ncbi:MAG: ISAzo13 family transposase [Christensenellaceae bacterium]|jgi:transposase|nr:ISAzo13 family transposase [Christensenellaceae bacterium]
MDSTDLVALEHHIRSTMPSLNEYQKRLFLASEAMKLGRGGLTIISQISGVSRQTLAKGINELENSEILPNARTRKEGGGRKSVIETQSNILNDLLELVLQKSGSDLPLLWTTMSHTQLCNLLKERGYNVSVSLVGNLLKQLGFGLYINKNELINTRSATERAYQYNHINNQIARGHSKGIPVIFIDIKAQDKINTANDILIDDINNYLKQETLLNSSYYEAHEILKKLGFSSVKIKGRSAILAVDTIKAWYDVQFNTMLNCCDEIIIISNYDDCDSLSYHIWVCELQKLSNAINKTISVVHFHPGTCKWNNIRHAMFSVVTKEKLGSLYADMCITVSLIADTTTTMEILPEVYISNETDYNINLENFDDDFKKIVVFRNKSNSDWNFMLSPD